MQCARRMSPMKIDSHKAIIALWPGLPAFADAVDVPLSTAHSWHRRNSIPHTRYPEVLRAAAQWPETCFLTEELLIATSPNAWRHDEMKAEVLAIVEGIDRLANRITLRLPRHYALAALRGDVSLPSLVLAGKRFNELRDELCVVADALDSSSHN